MLCYNIDMVSNLNKSPLCNVSLFSIFWALQILTSKLAYAAGAKLVPFVVQTFTITFIVLTIYVLPREYKDLKNLSPRIWLGLLIAGGIHMGIGSALSYMGIALTSAINAGALGQFGTVTTPVLAWFILKEKFTLAKTVSIITIILGVFLLVTKGQLVIPHIGDILLLLSCIAWSLGNVLVKRIVKSTSVSENIAAFMRPAAGLPLLIFFILLTPLYPPPVKAIFSENYFDFHYLGFVILNGILTAICFICLIKTLKVASASYMSMMSATTPILVTLLAVIFLKEKLYLVQIIGITLIIASGTLTQYLKTDKH
jgi:drug/metabolite transporter (DMT)-like permease